MSAKPIAAPAPRRASPPFRLSGRSTIMLAAIVAIVVIYATDQVAPATSDRQAQLRIWLAARATGIVTLLLLTFQICLGLVLSHPTNKSTWKLSKRIFPWHEHLWVFVMAFLLVHIVSLILDPYAGVGIAGSFIPGLSSYRSSPVALGTLALYAFLITAVTARYTKLLPPGMWLSIHRLALIVFVLAWLHGMLSGTDSQALRPLYVAAGLAVVGAGFYRYWASRKGRPSFDTSRTEVKR
jgi:sulfoxide reductase heme-binding subunit YedZ